MESLARFDVLARLRSELLLVTDDLDPFVPLSVLLEIDVLDEEETCLHPLVRDGSLGLSRDFPCADQANQIFEIGIVVTSVVSEAPLS